MAKRLLSSTLLVCALALAGCGADYYDEAYIRPASEPSAWQRPLNEYVPIDEALQVLYDIQTPFLEAMEFIAPGLSYDAGLGGEPGYIRATDPNHPIQRIDDIRNIFREVFSDYFVNTYIEELLFYRDYPFYKEINGILNRLMADFPSMWTWTYENARVGAFRDNSFTALVHDARYWHGWGETGMYSIDFVMTEHGWRINDIQTFHGR